MSKFCQKRTVMARGLLKILFRSSRIFIDQFSRDHVLKEQYFIIGG